MLLTDRIHQIIVCENKQKGRKMVKFHYALKRPKTLSYGVLIDLRVFILMSGL